jgi:hypothetical protein
MTNTERLRGLISTLKRIGGRLARYAPAGALAVWIAVLSMATPAAAQGLCSIPGAAGPLSLFFGLIVSIIAAAALFKYGGGALKWLTGGGRGNAKLRISLLVATIALFVALGADTILPWFMQQLGGSPGSVDIGCMIGGGG